MQPQLTRRQQSTYDAIFQHPIARHLNRRDVNDMLGVLAEVTEEHNGNLKATRNGQTAPKLQNLDTARKFHANSYISYLTARHEFERWYAVNGRDRLLALMDAVRDGRGFRF